MDKVQLIAIHLSATWLGLLAGVLSGAVMGVFFQREDWLGGYASFPRRLIRLGHISFFGLGLLNALFALTIALVPAQSVNGPAFGTNASTPSFHLASIALLTGAITMPMCCFLSAWRGRFRCLFPLPVGSLFAGTLLVLFNLLRS